MKGVRVARPAQRDLDEIWSAVANHEGVDLACRLVDEITDRFSMLAAMPESGRTRPEIAPEMRGFPAGDYMIYYRKAKRGGVQIWRVIHGMRNQLRVLRGSKH